MKIIITFLAVFLSSHTFAEKPYGMAGCGLGSMLQGKEGNQILAATTNGTGTQTFGISSGTSNCVTATERTNQITNFVEANYESLVTDMAKGNGESMKTLSGLYGCNEQIFAQEMKNNFSSIIPKHNDARFVIVRINNLIADSSQLSSSCINVL